MAFVFLGAACAAGRGTEWQSGRGRDHPLAGRIWDIGGGRFIDTVTLTARLAHGRFVLLGEQHDNPDHHRLQARLLGALIAAGRRPAVGFEMLDVDQGPALDRYLADRPTDAAGLGEAVGWNQSGWPAWALYQPIARTALEAGLPLVATNLSRTTVKALSHQARDSADATLRGRLGLDRPLDPDTHRAMAAEIRKSHCGYASDAMVEAMVTVQRARDAQMAERLAMAGRTDGAVLIAGLGHVRTDRGVPVHLAARVPGATVTSLAFLEVAAGATAPADYATQFGQDVLPFDFVWFTPRVDDLDPCEKFETELRRLKKTQ